MLHPVGIRDSWANLSRNSVFSMRPGGSSYSRACWIPLCSWLVGPLKKTLSYFKIPSNALMLKCTQISIILAILARNINFAQKINFLKDSTINLSKHIGLTFERIGLCAYVSAFRIHIILTWIRIRILGSTFGKSGSGSSDPPFRNSGSGS